jgi:YVTN family beta-propeller protein
MHASLRRCVLFLAALSLVANASTLAAERYLVCVSNEKGGTVTMIDGTSHELLATIEVGKRPRGIHASADGRWLYVAVSGSPIKGPPKLDAAGTPIPEDDDDDEADHAADGIAVVDIAARKFVRKLPAGTDPEEFAVSRDGRKLYIANEDVATLSVLDIESERIEHLVHVKPEPEGVALAPDGRHVYVTCETGGEVFVIDTQTHKSVAEISIGGRPRTVAFTADGATAFIPSETLGVVSVVDIAAHKVVRKIELPEKSRPMGTVVTRAGELWVSTGRAGKVCLVDPQQGKVLASIGVGPRPWGLTLSRDERLLYVANGPSNDVSIVDVVDRLELGRVKAGESPWSVAVVRVR